jgi:hypothetical protein
MYGSNSDEDNQALGLSLPLVDEGVGGDGWPPEPAVIAFCGVVGAGLDFWEKGISVWGVSGSTTTRMAEVSMKML